MKSNTSVVKPKLMSLSTEAPLIQDITDARPSYYSTSSPPVSGCFSTAESRLNFFSGRHKYNSRDLKSHNVSPVTDRSMLPFLAKDRSAFSKFASRNKMPDSGIPGSHFLFDKRWRNGTYINNDTEDDVLINRHPTSPLSQEFHVYHSHNLTRFAHRKELFPRDPRPLNCGSRSDYLASFPSVLLPATTPSVSGRVCLSQNYKNRTRMKNRACSLFPIDANNKDQSYPDPHLGASASFVQRLSEISSLEAETVRQEKMKRLRKINRQDS